MIQELQPRPSPVVYAKVPNVIGLYRHLPSGRYYGSKKVRGKRKKCSLKTTDRKIAERRLKAWVANLSLVNAGLEKTNFRQLLAQSELINQGKSKSTRCMNACITRLLERTWEWGIDIEVRAIRPSHLDEWLAKHETRLKNTSYNRYAGFLKQLFDIAVRDRIIAESPFGGVRTAWKKPQEPVRLVPTNEQF